MKRRITYLGIELAISTIGIVTGTIAIISAIMIIILLIEWSIIAILHLKNLFHARKYYNKLLEYLEYNKFLNMKNTKHILYIMEKN